MKANVKHSVYIVTSTPNLAPAKIIPHSHTPSPARSPTTVSITCRTRCATWSKLQATTAPRPHLRGIRRSTLGIRNRRLSLRLQQCGRVSWIGGAVRSERPSITQEIRMRRRNRKGGKGGVGVFSGVRVIGLCTKDYLLTRVVAVCASYDLCENHRLPFSLAVGRG